MDDDLGYPHLWKSPNESTVMGESAGNIECSIVLLCPLTQVQDSVSLRFPDLMAGDMHTTVPAGATAHLWSLLSCNLWPSSDCD